MLWKNLKQQNLADTLIVEHAAITEWDAIHNLIDWSRFEGKLADIHNNLRGEQAWYGLSDPQLEKQLTRDLLFRRFVGAYSNEFPRPFQPERPIFGA